MFDNSRYQNYDDALFIKRGWPHLMTLLSRPVLFIQAQLQQSIRRHERRRAMADLKNMPDYLLRDIGLTRSQVSMPREMQKKAAE
jgi:uncharacterized protein YjiS (DUF1127 family)